MYLTTALFSIYNIYVKVNLYDLLEVILFRIAKKKLEFT